MPSDPSCFTLALSSLPSSSSSSSACESLSHSDPLRSDVAARMAMCEIETAEGGKVPRECKDWQDGRRKSSVGGCVEALARSPQYWSSYSGYLREIVSFCSAFRRWSDLELAQEVNGESARTLKVFVEELREYERQRAGREARHDAAVQSTQKNVESLFSSLSDVSSFLSAASASHVSAFGEAISSLDRTSRAMLAQLDRLEVGVGYMAQTLQKEMAGTSQELRDMLREETRSHASDLSVITSTVNGRLLNSLEAFEAKQAFFLNNMGDLALTVKAVGADLQSTNSVMLDLQPLATHLAASLSDSLSSVSLLELQLASTSSANLAEAEKLATVLANLTDLVEQRQGRLAGLQTLSLVGAGLEETVWLVQMLWAL
ncbi:hypothetical protein JCM11641_000555 [Rhodosporidiobolus odoratus]